MITRARPRRATTAGAGIAGILAVGLLLSSCASGSGDATGSATATPEPSASVTVTPTPTSEPTAEPTTEPTTEPQDPDAAITAACDTLNTGYDQGRDGWLAARTQAAALTAQAAPAGGRYAQADSTMQAFAATTYPGASSSADEVNAYLDSYLTVVSMCADFGVTLKTE
ncbi:hypothetical protein GCM10010988_33420 [Cnuibacter physcomitrellae]|uniref:Uncharacterized protein n=1 Tax=Cnuibacter physcomitrellae TaxID=1619308 RepID=A0A1X9LHD7_9MICO|nr:hypothetical protein [Cnuibacter physcomitrellae]ARJ04547.1 hypothetical protein B5808_04385 [Cnuibacter physcomitrellae]GGI41304.1 hypothetical protein GCM10010988_33420 [Cnuibacter physcomitrellae]